MNRLLRLAAAATLLIAGCATVPVEQPVPEPTPAPPAWRNQPRDQPWDAHEGDRRWWHGFSDKRLAALVERAIEANHDLAGAASRLASANALAKAATAERLPYIGLEATTARQRTPKTRIAGGSENDAPAWSSPFMANAHQGGLKASYDIDIAGRLSRAKSSALKEAQAAGWDLDAARIALIHAVVTAYLEYRYADATIRSAAERKRINEELVRIEQVRAQAGLAAAKAVRDAEILLSETEKELSLLNKDAEVSRAQLAILSGESPQGFGLDLPVRDKLPMALRVPPDLPAEVLASRPDLRAAWARVEAAGIDVERARLERFPKLTLTGAIGFASNALSGFLRKDALAWMLGVEAGAPLFDGGRIEARIEQGQANLDGAIATYRQSVLVALKDVEQSLATLNSADRQRTEASRTVDRALQTEREAEREYAAGRIGRGALAKERIQRNLAESALLDSERSVAIAGAQVFLAFGKQ